MSVGQVPAHGCNLSTNERQAVNLLRVSCFRTLAVPPLRTGCGDGLFSESLASAPSLVATLSTVSTSSVSLTGVDVSSALLECARATRSYRELCRHDLNKPGALVDGFNEDTFDAAVCVGVLTYIDPSNVPDLLCQMACIVKPGGVVVYTCRTDMSAAWDARAAELEAQMMWEQTARLEEVPYLPNNPDYAGDIEMNICAYTVL